MTFHVILLSLMGMDINYLLGMEQTKPCVLQGQVFKCLTPGEGKIVTWQTVKVIAWQGRMI